MVTSKHQRWKRRQVIYRARSCLGGCVGTACLIPIGIIVRVLPFSLMEYCNVVPRRQYMNAYQWRAQILAQVTTVGLIERRYAVASIIETVMRLILCDDDVAYLRDIKECELRCCAAES
jgi:hypothetical protein